MNPWLETVMAVLACLISAWICSRVARFESSGWWLAYLIPLAVVIGYGVFVRRPDWSLHPALSWILIGRWRYTLVGVAVAGLLSTLRAKLPKPQDRRALSFLTVVTLVYVSLWPTLASAFNQEYLRSLKTQIDRDGVCRQHTDYTCGPAAAVTALLRLRIRADEGDLAAENLLTIAEALTLQTRALQQLLQWRPTDDSLLLDDLALSAASSAGARCRQA
jgi:hypothetical protein